MGRLTDEAIIAGGVFVVTVGKIISVVPLDPILEAKGWKECIDCEHPPPVTVALWVTKHLSRDLPLDQQASVTIYVTDIYKSVLQQMKEESEVRDEYA